MLSSRPVNVFGNTKTPGRGTFRSANQAENTIFPSTKRTVGKANTPFHSTSTTGSNNDQYSEDDNDASPLKQRAGSPVKQLQSTSFPTKSAQNKTPFHGNAGAGYRDVIFTKSPAKPILHTPLPSVKKRFNYDSFTFNVATPALHLRPDSPLGEEQEQDSLSTPLASSMRRTSRGSRMSMEKSFQTPQNNGRHWDVSDISIQLNDLQIEEEDPDTVTIDEEAEIEYMPPKVEVPYEPPFDFKFPDYKKVGSNFLSGYYMDPKEALAELPSFSEPFEVPQLEEVERLSSVTYTSEDSDDPFVQARRSRAAQASSKPKPTLKSTAAPGRTISRVTSAPTTAAARTRPTSALPSTTSSRSVTGSSTTTTARSRPPSRPATAAAHVSGSRFTTSATGRGAAVSQTTGRPASAASVAPSAQRKLTVPASGTATTTRRVGTSAAQGSQPSKPVSSSRSALNVTRPTTSTAARAGTGVATKAPIATRTGTGTTATRSAAPTTLRGRSNTTPSLPSRPTTAPGRVAAATKATSSSSKTNASLGSKKPDSKLSKEDSGELAWAEKLMAGSAPTAEEDFLFDV